ncbi:phenylacetic acid degradation protein PaaN [Martelella soudanensis]|uniref:phenylacetic acid degradation protein PaaN n=1 Tax=unclassified Martelella TaxID=2629616 RepID=UPI0015DFF2DF|nr:MULTISPECIES: phenylacetic acid degradation protein PaaN [unclassified Martelella]
MTNLYDRHSALLARAAEALRTRVFWTPFPEVPSGKIYGESAMADGTAAFEALVGNAFDIPGHPETRRVGRENAPWGKSLSISYPSADPATLIAASIKAADRWASADPETRSGILLEALTRLNAMSFLIGHATMHATGQAFPMAFQAGGPHAQDRGLEAVAAAFAEMTRSAAAATWEKPQGKREPITLEKRWRIVPRGISLMIGCQTFPNWNGYPGLFASLATGNTLIVKPHPGAILPLALTVKVLREVLAEEGFSPDVVLLAADEPGAEITKTLVEAGVFSIIDYTGSSVFAAWLRQNAGSALVFTEESGVNSITITGTDDFAGMCDNIAFSLSLYSGQMCTSPQNLYLPQGGIETNEGHKSFDDVVGGIVAAVDRLLEDGTQASSICGAIASPATFERIEKARHAGRVVRESRETGLGASATPLLVVSGEHEDGPWNHECFGPVSFFIACADAHAAIARAAAIAREKGAITAALYATDGALIDEAATAFARAGVNLSVNLTGNIYVNQSAAFSDYHVTGANPSGNASLTDTAFVAPRFRRVMIRWPKAA